MRSGLRPTPADTGSQPGTRYGPRAMEPQSHDHAAHPHRFGAQAKSKSERRTWWVIALTAVMMVAEIVAGTLYDSMALLADGWHMGTHAAALGITVFAFVFARRHADDPRYTFGTGKVSALGGFASAVALAIVALHVLGDSVERLRAPEVPRFDEAIVVAIIGLVVNIVSALLLGDGSDEHGHGHGHGHGHADHRDQNIRGAYLHVLSDALTSALAIIALFAGKHLGWIWLDPLMGVVGAVLIAIWSLGLMRDSAQVLLDAQVPLSRREAIREALEHEDTRVTDLHVWRVGPRHEAAIVAILSSSPQPPEHYKARLGDFPALVHLTVEVHWPRDSARDHAE